LVIIQSEKEIVMDCFAAVMTGKGTGAISTIQVFGDSAGDVIGRIFEPARKGPADFQTSKILLGKIFDGDKTIDQVTIGCEHPRTFALHCHGNPLIVEMIIQLLQKHDVKILSPEQLLSKIPAQNQTGTITLEANLHLPKAKTLSGTKIITNQIYAGLTQKAQNWLEGINKISLDEMKTEAGKILHDTQIAKLIIYGCTAVLAGPPNSGKSSLLNRLAGRQKSIVTDIKGTTRDWVSAQCQIGALSLELIDTAGLNEQYTTPEQSIETAAQEKTSEILEKTDLILLVLDNSQDEHPNEKLLQKLAHKKVITVLNKSDLPAKFEAGNLPSFLSNLVTVSAKTGKNIKTLIEKILQITGTTDFDLQTTVCFSNRQENLLRQITTTKSNKQATVIITELLNGQLCV
jgi:tRNA modification GTPase